MNVTLTSYLPHSRHKLKTLLVSYVLARSLPILLAILSVARAIITRMEYTTAETADAN